MTSDNVRIPHSILYRLILMASPSARSHWLDCILSFYFGTQGTTNERIGDAIWTMFVNASSADIDLFFNMVKDLSRTIGPIDEWLPNEQSFPVLNYQIWAQYRALDPRA